MTGVDPTTAPTYTVSEAARFLGMSAATLRHWLQGYEYDTKSGPSRSEPLTIIGESSDGIIRISFMNLVEVHMVQSFQVRGVRTRKIRSTVVAMRARFEDEYPFAKHSFLTDGIDIFLEIADSIIDLAAPKQKLIVNALTENASRVVWDESGLPTSFYPYTRGDREKETPKNVSIDPRIASGRPMIQGVLTSVIAYRVFAGEEEDEVARDYGIEPRLVTEALRCEFWRRTA